MVTFQVDDMTCGRCAGAISRAVAALDKSARVDIRMQQQLVRVSSSASAADLAEAIRDAGYNPQEVQEAMVQPAASRVAGGCGCGCGPRKPAALDAGQATGAAAGSCCS